MGGGASHRKEEEAAVSDPDVQNTVAGPGGAASDLAALLYGLDPSVSELLSEKQQEQISNLQALLSEPGWRSGSNKGSVSVRYKFCKDTGLYYACFDCEVPDTAKSLFEDFNQGRAQQRYSEVCTEERVLAITERPFPLGHERLVRGIYRMPYPMQDRDFVWAEWAALLAAVDGGSLYLSIAHSPENEAAFCPPEPDKYVRAHLQVSATFARQAPGETNARMAFLIQGDIRGKMPKSLQNLLAGNASTYLSRFREAHLVASGRHERGPGPALAAAAA